MSPHRHTSIEDRNATPASRRPFASRTTGVSVVLLSAFALAAPWISAQTTPKLAAFYTPIPETLVDSSYRPLNIAPSMLGIADLNGDGNQDLVVLGLGSVSVPCCAPPQYRQWNRQKVPVHWGLL